MLMHNEYMCLYVRLCTGYVQIPVHLVKNASSDSVGVE